MNDEDLSRIETALGIQLPAAYKHRMRSYPIPILAGNKDRELWDDADALIELNQELRKGGSGGVNPWPAHLFSLGTDHGGCTMAMDLSTPEPLVWWVDRCHLTDEAGSEKERFDDWIIEFVRDTSSDLTDEGLDPTASAELLAAQEKTSVWQDMTSCLGCLVTLSIALTALAWLVSWLKKLF